MVELRPRLMSKLTIEPRAGGRAVNLREGGLGRVDLRVALLLREPALVAGGVGLAVLVLGLGLGPNAVNVGLVLHPLDLRDEGEDRYDEYKDD